MDVGTVQQVDIDQEMRAAYLDYAMSVIVSRALPDARDGLKPVHRRILYAMYDMGLRPDTPYRKSARIVGEVLGKYHPHSDAAVYDAMVRLAQDFSMRYQLVDGQGNFGSIDGDAAAAMRYTEARMADMGLDLLTDIGKDTVDYAENFDGSLDEPSVLPSALPNLLINGSSGIAVGMSTSVPPHNLTETVDALIYMLDNWESLDDIGVADLMQFIKGPDFPTGGVMFRYDSSGNDRIANAYATGRGKITLQANAHVVQLSGNRSRIIITELPYQTNKTNLIERIATLVRDVRIEGVTDLRDESDRQGMRIVLDMTRNVDPYDMLASLYKLTPMRQTFSVIMLALVEGEPRLLSLKQALRVFLDHRLHIVKRRSEYDLARAQERAHILEGLLIALDNLDEVIDIIRKSRSAETAHTNLKRAFKLSDEQATAILNMPLRRLAALEAKRIEQEYKEKQKLIELLTRMLASPQMMRGAIKEELTELRELYADARRTLVVEGAAGDAVSVADLIPDKESWVVITESGRISRTFDDVMPRVTQKVKDPPRVILLTGASDTLYVFASNGEAATVPVHQITQVHDFEAGAPVSAVTPLDPDHEVVAALSVPPGDFPGFITMGSEEGMIKRVTSEDLPGLTAKPFEVMTIGDDDRMGWALWTLGDDEVIMVTAQGKAIRFDEDEVRPMGLRAGGVRGVKLADDTDRVVGMMLSEPGKAVWVITNTGLAKSSLIEDYPVQGRYGQGVITIKMGDRNAEVAAAAIGSIDDTLTVVTSRTKPKYMSFGLAPHGRRNMAGESVIALGENEVVQYVVTAQMRIAANDLVEEEMAEEAEDE